MMPLILRRPRDALLFRSGVATTARALDETVTQLQQQVKQLQELLKAEREQRAFDCREYESQIATLMRDLLHARYELARRDREAAFAAAPCASQAVH